MGRSLQHVGKGGGAMRWHALMSFVVSMRRDNRNKKMRTSPFFGPALSSPCCSSASSRFHSWGAAVGLSWTEFLFSYSVTTEARHNPCQLVPPSIRLSTPEVGNGLPTLFILSSIQNVGLPNIGTKRIQGSIHRRFWQCRDSSDMLEHPGPLGNSHRVCRSCHGAYYTLPPYPRPATGSFRGSAEAPAAGLGIEPSKFAIISRISFSFSFNS